MKSRKDRNKKIHSQMKEENTKSMVENQSNINDENTNSENKSHEKTGSTNLENQDRESTILDGGSQPEYKFVKETIIDKRAKLKMNLMKILSGFLAVALIACVAFIVGGRSHIGDDDSKDSDTISSNDESPSQTEDPTSETNTSENITDEYVPTPEEVLQKRIISSVVMLSVYSDVYENESVEDARIDTESDITIKRNQANNTDSTTDDLASMLDGMESTSENKTPSTTEETTEELRKGHIIGKYSGVIISKSDDFFILTHIDSVAGGDAIYAVFGGQYEVKADICYKDIDTNIAILKIPAKGLSGAIDNVTGEAIISKNGQAEIGNQVYFSGMMGDKDCSIVQASVISTGEEHYGVDVDYSIYKVNIAWNANKDGFLFDNAGNLTGMYMPLKRDGSIVSIQDLTGINSLIESVIDEKKVPFIGITGQKVSVEVEKLVGHNMPDGVYVTDVAVDSPAYKAGIMVGDIIHRAEATSIRSISDIRGLIDKKNVGDTITIYIYRNIVSKYNTYSIDVKLGER